MQLIYGVDFQEETKLLDSLTVISGDLTKLDQRKRHCDSSSFRSKARD